MKSPKTLLGFCSGFTFLMALSFFSSATLAVFAIGDDQFSLIFATTISSLFFFIVGASIRFMLEAVTYVTKTLDEMMIQLKRQNIYLGKQVEELETLTSRQAARRQQR